MWRHTHPRLYELYNLTRNLEESNHPERNYFHRFEEEINHPLSKERIQSLENDLSRIDIESWNYLKEKLQKIKYITNPHKERYWQQLSDLFNEVKGYIYLQDIGYDEIQFIKEDKGETPDFYAIGSKGTALLEVKTINISDKEVKYRNPNIPPKCKSIEPGIDEGLKSQILKISDKAKNQLQNYCNDNKLYEAKLFIMICVNFDDGWKGLEQNFRELKQLIETNKPKHIEEILPRQGYQL